MVQVAWPPWMQSITCRRLDLHRVRVIRESVGRGPIDKLLSLFPLICCVISRTVKKDNIDGGVLLCAFAVEPCQVVRAAPVTVERGQAVRAAPVTIEFGQVVRADPLTVYNGVSESRR